MKKKVIVSVSNDLVSDQRVDKMCNSLLNMGADILLVGRKRKTSPPLPDRKYKTYRFSLLFDKGILFYAEFNIRLFLLLLFKRRVDILVSNDLDTLLPNVLVSKWRKNHLVYDSHEYFTEVAELINHPKKQVVWKHIECYCFPKLKQVITVSESIAELYRKEYNMDVKVVRNIPTRRKYEIRKTRTELHLPENKNILLLQGSGINIHRGAEELVKAMQYINNAVLLIIGSGDVIGKLKEMTKELSLSEKIQFIPRMPFEQLYDYTVHADLGFSLDKDISINHRFALPNKLFDFIRAQVPVVVSNLVEIRKIIEQYHIGIVLKDNQVETIAHAVNSLLADKKLYQQLKQNTLLASDELCWENEEKTLKEIYLPLLHRSK